MDQLTSPTFTAKNPNSIQQMFGTISAKYDLANTVLSAGIHHRWKKRVVRESGVRTGDAVLDCATGTGDLAFLFEKAGANPVIGSDFCTPMLEVAQEKAKRLGSQAKFEWADVTRLQYPDQNFQVASISFGIRNVQDPLQALNELGRVVKPGGKVLVLEFGQPRSRILGFLYNFYSKKILPRMGGWISGAPQAYQYLQTSSAAFPCGNEFLKIAMSTGRFSSGQIIPFQSGIAYLYVLHRK